MDGGNLLKVSEERFLVGLKPGDDGKDARRLASSLDQKYGCLCTGIPLRSPDYLHLDMVLAKLGNRGWLMYGPGLGDVDPIGETWSNVFGGLPVIEVTQSEAEQLACNVLVIGNFVIGSIPHRLSREIEALGFETIQVPLGEFRKAGGGAHCLTNELHLPEVAVESRVRNT